MIDGAAVSTVEGLARGGHLHAVQAAFVQARSLQCGYCTPGMVMSVVSLIQRDGMPSDEAIHQGLAGNICRCGGYPRIVQAVHAAAAMQGDLGRGAATEQIPAARARPQQMARRSGRLCCRRLMAIRALNAIGAGPLSAGHV